jgi:hypothetical protein
VIDTIGIKVTPLSSVDLFRAPHSNALQVQERYRLIDGARFDRTIILIPEN